MRKNKQQQKLVKKLVEASFENGKLIESQVIKSIKVLKSLPRHQAILALSVYLKELKRRQREHTMYIETSIPLTSNQLISIKKIINKKVKITKVETHVNPQIIGGFKLRVGDAVWDKSILGWA